MSSESKFRIPILFLFFPLFGCVIPPGEKCPCAEGYICCMPVGENKNKCITVEEYDTFESCQTKITASDSQRGDQFGISVSISEKSAIFGAPDNNGDVANPIDDVGAAYIFQFINGQWFEKQKLTASDAQAHYGFGHAVSISDDLAIVGSYANGAAYIFQFKNSEWIETDRLTASNYNTEIFFGHAVSINDDFAIVGSANLTGGLDVHPGATAYIFKLESGEWVENAKLTASDGNPNDSFATSVSISGDFAIVGARRADEAMGEPDDALDGPGAAYIFQIENGVWNEKQKLIASDAQSEDSFGRSVSVSGYVAIVGAPYEDGGNGDPLQNAGAVYIFQLENGLWLEKQKLTASDAQNHDSFGRSVSRSENVVIIGASGGEAAYIFKLENGEWLENKKLTAADAQNFDRYGDSVSISKDTVIIGAYCEDGNIGDPQIPDDGPGAAYIFRLKN